MKLDDILDEWQKDSKIDITDLDRESLDISYLHSKYLRELSSERLKLRGYKLKFKQLQSNLFRYFKGEFNSDIDMLKQLEREPCQIRILRNDIQEYVDGDKAIINIKSQIQVCEEKVTVLEEIMKSISNRAFQITNAINWKKLVGGL